MFQTGMPPGTYCDLISGHKLESSCSGVTVTVDAEQKIHAVLPTEAGERMIAFTIEVSLRLAFSSNKTGYIRCRMILIFTSCLQDKVNDVNGHGDTDTRTTADSPLGQ